MTQDKRGYRQAKKRITREVEKVFPEWMMSLSLLLQGDNVHVAVSKTVADAPVILKEELLKLMDFMEKDPNSIKPYLNFFGTLDVPDVQSSMKMLYSMAEYGSGDMGGQIEELVERNSQMLDKAEKMKMEDYLSEKWLLVYKTGFLSTKVAFRLQIFNCQLQRWRISLQSGISSYMGV